MVIRGVYMIKIIYNNKILQVILGVIFGFLVLRILNFSEGKSIYFSIALILAICIVTIVSIKFIRYFWRDSSIIKITLSLLLMTAFLGGGVSLFSIAGFSMFPYRAFFLMLSLLYLTRILMGKSPVNWKQIQIKPFIYFLLFWCGYAVCSVVWAKSLTDAIQEIVFLLIGVFIIIFVVNTYNSEKRYYEFFTIWILMTFLLVTIGLINHFEHLHLPISRINNAYSYQQGIPTAVFVNENDYASFLAISLFFLVALVHYFPNKLIKIIGLIGVMASAYLILITESRANYISIALGFVFWFLFMITAKLRKQITIFGLLAAIGAFVLFSERIMIVLKSIYVQLSLLFITNDASASVDIRKNLLKNIQIFIEDTYGFGIGAGNAEYYMRNFGVYETMNNYNVHNWWAETFVHYGAVILIIYIIMIIYLFIKIFNYNKTINDWKINMINESILCGLVVFPLASVSPNSFMALTYNWLFIAFAFGLVQYYNKKEKGEDNEETI